MIRVYWDTMLLIYWLEHSPTFGSRIDRVYTHMRARGDQLCASQFSLCELLVLPMQRGDLARAEAALRLFESPAIKVLPLGSAAAPHFARARIAGATPPDALHLAIAAAHEVDLFLTNDRRLQKLHVPGIGFIAGLDCGLY